MHNVFDTLTIVSKYKRLYERRCQEIMKKYDLRVADIDVLYYVAHSGPKNLAKDIVDNGMSKANVSKSVEHLHQKGLVLLKEDREDRRCVHIEPALSAQVIIDEVEEIRREIGIALSAGISEEDRQVVKRILKQMNSNLTRELAEGECEKQSVQEQQSVQEKQPVQEQQPVQKQKSVQEQQPVQKQRSVQEQQPVQE